MKRVLLLLGLCCGGYILTACGGGQGSGLQAVRSSGTVILKITIPAMSKLAMSAPRTGSAANSRLIPSNTVNLHITYTAVDTTTGLLLTTGTTQGDGVLDISVSPGITPLVQAATLKNFAAGMNNPVTIVAQDTNGAAVAVGNTFINIAPGATSTGQSVTLQSAVNAASISLSPTGAVPALLSAGSSETLKDNLTNTSSTAVTTEKPSTLSWSIAPAGYANGVTNADGTFTVSEMLPGTVTVTVVYAEYNTTIKSASVTITLSTPKFVPPATTAEYLESDGITNVPAANLFDVSYVGGSLFYDPTLVSGITKGFSRVAPVSTGFNPTNDVVEFDSAFPPGPTFCGPTSRMAFLPGATPAADQWVITGLGGTQVSAFPSGYKNRSVGGNWEYPAIPFNPGTLVDIDAKGSLVYLLEKVGASYQIETLSGSGVSQGITVIPAIADAPKNMAVGQVLNSAGTLIETDFYLAGSTHIARLKLVGSTTTLNPDFTVSAQTAISPVDIATSTNSAYLCELDSAGKINMFYTTDGTAAPVSGPLSAGTTLIPASPTVAGSRLSTGAAGNDILLFVTDQNAGLTQIEAYSVQ